jgi:hypothetical protein
MLANCHQFQLAQEVTLVVNLATPTHLVQCNVFVCPEMFDVLNVYA